MTSTLRNFSHLEGLVRDQFGLPGLRPRQTEVLRRLVEGQSGLAVMPTGGGKSLFYQLWASQEDAFVLVISPLIALMQDQVDQARQFGVKATCINATVSREDREQRLRAVAEGRVNLLFVTPERFRQPEFREVVAGRPVSLLAVDEAHCISAWGHDFRPDYTKLSEIRAFLGDPLTLALTATATQIVQKEILSQLRIEHGFREVDSIERPELALNVHEVMGHDEKIRAIIGLRHMVQGPMLIYGSLISTLYKVSEDLGRLGLMPAIYHGQMNSGDRKRVLREFQSDPNAFMLATPAFGLGINKSNLRAVVHLELPLALESYFQEVGRAGRDGQPADGHLLFDEDDATIQMDFIKWANPDAGFISSVYRLIANNETRVAQEGANFLRDQMNFYNSRDYRVETSLNLLEKWGCLVPAKNRLGFSPVREPSEDDLTGLRTKERLKVQNEKLYQMVEFSKDRESCRMRRIQNYFGQQAEGRCGRCDNCRAAE